MNTVNHHHDHHYKYNSDNNKNKFIKLNRQPRSAKNDNIESSSSSSTTIIKQFTILALLPGENAPLITRALRDGQSKWEISTHRSDYWNEFINKTGMSSMNNNNNVQLSPLRASDIQLTVYSEPIQNDTERILTSTCEWIKIHKPALILSLLDPYRSFYVAMIAQQSLIPFISMTQNYQNEINPITPSSSSSLTITKNEEKEEEAKLLKFQSPCNFDD
ncbi:hypothetical protein HUG17_2624 [Dermatophagoides farinae]|uniref:Uncharacterized protein n=1 Tax=Dermatophagoides farinae TaxID=6954 RepID=A0A9D4NT91_DERFA|nr:hypothetical protein HUG17_2624 [Dermatophagoides farinae]